MYIRSFHSVCTFLKDRNYRIIIVGQRPTVLAAGTGWKLFDSISLSLWSTIYPWSIRYILHFSFLLLFLLPLFAERGGGCLIYRAVRVCSRWVKHIVVYAHGRRREHWNTANHRKLPQTTTNHCQISTNHHKPVKMFLITIKYIYFYTFDKVFINWIILYHQKRHSILSPHFSLYVVLSN